LPVLNFLGDRHSQARFNQMVLRLGLENDIPSRTDLSVSKKSDLLAASWCCDPMTSFRQLMAAPRWPKPL